VTLDYDPTATEETKESYDPDQTVTLSMQRTEQSAGAQPVAAGVPGVASNAPNSQALPVYPAQSSAPQTAKSEAGTYAATKTLRHVIEGPGRVRRMTAAIVVNDRLAQLATKDKAAQWQPRSPEELLNLTALAQAAVGFDATRGDLLEVKDLAFEDNRMQPTVTVPGQILATAEAGFSEVCGPFDGPAGGGGFRGSPRPAPRPVCAGSVSQGSAQGVAGPCRSCGTAHLEDARAGRGGPGTAQVTGDLRAGDRPPQARAYAKLTAAPELDSLRLMGKGK
jgi:hypothetical protein